MNDLINESIPGLREASKKRAGYRKILLKYIRTKFDLYPQNEKRNALKKRIGRGQLGSLSDMDICFHAKLIQDIEEGLIK